MFYALYSWLKCIFSSHLFSMSTHTFWEWECVRWIWFGQYYEIIFFFPDYNDSLCNSLFMVAILESAKIIWEHWLKKTTTTIMQCGFVRRLYSQREIHITSRMLVHFIAHFHLGFSSFCSIKWSDAHLLYHGYHLTLEVDIHWKWH